MNSFSHGPFTFAPGRAASIAGAQARRWSFAYGVDILAERSLPVSASQSEIIEAFEEDRAAFIRNAQRKHAPARVVLVDYESGEEIAYFFSYDSCGMTPGLIDDRSRYWLRSSNNRYSRPATLTEYARIAAEHVAPARSWIGALLPNDILTQDAEEWRAPTSWEIKHVVGEGSFTGLSGAKAAALVGISPQNFRKYTARDGASTRQAISYAAWHLLLHKLGVQRA